MERNERGIFRKSTSNKCTALKSEKARQNVNSFAHSNPYFPLDVTSFRHVARQNDPA